MSQDLYAVKLSQRAYKELTLSKGGTQVLIHDNNVAFRGTKGWRDVLTDVIFLPWWSWRLRGFFHFGIMVACGRISKQIIDRLDLSKPITVTGHSLGGGLAVAFARLLQRKGAARVTCITFGAPRVCKIRTARRLAECGVVWRQYSHHGDPVTNMPLRSTLWRHVRELMIGRDDGDWLDVDAHSIVEYRKSIEQFSSPISQD